MTRVSGVLAARVMSGIAWVGAHLIYGILLLLYRVDRRLLIGGIAATILLAVALIVLL